MPVIPVSAPVHTTTSVISSPPDPVTPLERVQSNTHEAQEERVRLDNDLGDGSIVVGRHAATVRQERLDAEGKHFLEREASVAGDSIGLYARELGQEVAISFHGANIAAAEAIERGGGVLDVGSSILLGVTRQSELFDDPNYNIRLNPSQLKGVRDQLDERGVDYTSNVGIAAHAASSSFELSIILDKHDEFVERMSRLADAGASGLAVNIAGGMLDIDTLIAGGAVGKLSKLRLLAKLDAGVTAGKITKHEAALLGQRTTRIGNIVTGAEAGATTTAVGETFHAWADPNADVRDVLTAVAVGSALVGGIGAIIPTKSNTDIVSTIVNNRLLNNAYKTAKDAEPKKAAPVELDLEGSVGSAKPKGAGVDIRMSSEGAQLQMDKSEKYLDDNPDFEFALHDLDEFIEDTATPAQRLIQGAAQEAYKAIKKTPFITDFDRIIRDGGTVGKVLALKLLETPVGQLVNNNGGSAVANWVGRQASSRFAPNAANHYKVWAKDAGIKSMSKRNFFTGQIEFGRAIREYRAELQMDRVPANTHPAVLAASEDIDATYKFLLDQHQRYGTEGFEDVVYKKGHMSTDWSGPKAAAIELDVGSDVLIQTMKKGIMNKTPDMSDELAFRYATAIHRHMRSADLGNPMGMLGMTSENGVASLEGAIETSGSHIGTGMTPREMALKFLYKDGEGGTAKASRQKIDIDLSVPIPGTDKTLLDLQNNDVYATLDRAVRSQSRIAGLSSQDVQLREWEDMRAAAADEALATGRDVKAAVRAIDDVASMYSDGAVRGGAGRVVGRLNKLAILSFLPQLGVTQIAEAGVAMSVSGVRAWSHYAGMSVPTMIKGKDLGLLDSLTGIASYRGDHKLWVRTDQLDDVNLQDSKQFMQHVDMAMDQGTRALGHISGFYKVNELLHSVAALSMNDYMIKNILKGTQSRRLSSMGVDDEFRAVIQRYSDEGHIKFDKDGYVEDMGVEAWDANDLQLLQMITTRNMDQTVQKARPGEAHAWQYETMGALFSSLRTFTFTALHKQLIRTGRLADAESFNMLLATTGTAALAFTIKQTINGKTDQLGPEDIAKGALQWSALLSPALMAVDTAAYLTGADHLGGPFPLNQWKTQHGGLMSLPPGIAALNNQFKLGRIPLDLLDGEFDRQTYEALQGIPIIGRSYPAALFKQLPGLFAKDEPNN